MTVVKKYMPGRRHCVYVSADGFASGQNLLCLRAKNGIEHTSWTIVHRENIFATKKEATAEQRRILEPAS